MKKIKKIKKLVIRRKKTINDDPCPCDLCVARAKRTPEEHNSFIEKNYV